MSEPQHVAAMLACGGRHWAWGHWGWGHWGWGQASAAIPLLAAISVPAWPGEVLAVAAVLRGVHLTAGVPVKFAAVFRLRSIGHLAVHPGSPP
jgi:hypothetical protein